jgi:hypothetical protein
MPTFIMLTRLNPDAVRSPRGLEQLERDDVERRQHCGGLRAFARRMVSVSPRTPTAKCVIA